MYTVPMNIYFNIIFTLLYRKKTSLTNTTRLVMLVQMQLFLYNCCNMEAPKAKWQSELAEIELKMVGLLTCAKKLFSFGIQYFSNLVSAWQYNVTVYADLYQRISLWAIYCGGHPNIVYCSFVLGIECECDCGCHRLMNAVVFWYFSSTEGTNSSTRTIPNSPIRYIRN